MADPYNAAIAAAHAQLAAALTPPAPVGPASLPPQFVGRYAGAPLPQQPAAAPVTPYVPPPAGAPATPGGMPQMGWPMALPYTAAQANAAPASAPAAPAASGYVPRFDMNSPAVRAAIGAPVPSATTAPGVVQPANAASTPPAGGYDPTQITPVAAGITPARGSAFVSGLPDYVAQQPRPVGQSPQIGPDGQWDVPPLPGGEPGGGGDDGGAYAGQGTWAAAAMSRQGGGMSAGGGYAGVGSGRLIDPEGRINAGFDRQNATASDFMNKALDYIQGGGNIFERATRGRAIGNILHAVMGPNNVGQVQGQGVDSLNNANAGIEGSENYAEANKFGSIAGLIGRTDETAERQHEADTGSIPMGDVIRPDPKTGFGMAVPVYGPRPKAGATASPYDLSPQKAKPQEGATGKTPDGRKTVYKNGQWGLAE